MLCSKRKRFLFEPILFFLRFAYGKERFSYHGGTRFKNTHSGAARRSCRQADEQLIS